MNIFISRRECAEKFGVTPQTISNYIEKGLLSYRKINDTILINRDDADAFFKKYIKDYIADEEEVKRLSYEMKSTKERLSRELTDIVSSFRTASSFGKKVKVMYGMILSSDAIVGSCLSEKEIHVMKRFLCEGFNSAEIASELDVTTSAVHHIVDRSLEKIKASFGLMGTYQEDNRRLLERAEKQGMHISALSKEVSMLRRKLERSGITDGKQPSVRIDRCGFSERVMKCLRRGGLITLGDVAGYGRTRLERLNGFGGKAMKEVTEKLDKYNLQLEE